MTGIAAISWRKKKPRLAWTKRGSVSSLRHTSECFKGMVPVLCRLPDAMRLDPAKAVPALDHMGVRLVIVAMPDYRPAPTAWPEIQVVNLFAGEIH